MTSNDGRKPRRPAIIHNNYDEVIDKVEKINPQSGDIVIVTVKDSYKNRVPDYDRADYLRRVARTAQEAVHDDVRVIATWDNVSFRMVNDEDLARMGLKKTRT